MNCTFEELPLVLMTLKSECLLLGRGDLWVKWQSNSHLGVGQCEGCRGGICVSAQMQMVGREFSLLCDNGTLGVK